MRKLTLFVAICLLVITTSAWALTDLQIKTYVNKHFDITKKLKAIKDLQKARESEVNKIKTKYNYNVMMAEIKTINDIYQPQLETLTNQYELLINEIESQ